MGLPGERNRALKPLKELKELEANSTEIFMDSALEKYMQRPTTAEFETILIMDYFKHWDILVNSRAPRKNAVSIRTVNGEMFNKQSGHTLL